MNKTWKEKDEVGLEKLVRDYIYKKGVFDSSRGMPYRINLKRNYQEMVDGLWLKMPDNFEIDGKVLVKGHNPKLGIRYIQVFTKESFARMKSLKKPERVRVMYY